MHNGQESSLIRVNRIKRGADIVRRERKLACEGLWRKMHATRVKDEEIRDGG